VQTEPDPSRLDDEVRRLEASLAAARDASRRRGRTLAALSAIVLACAGGFLYDAWSTVQHQWSNERLAKSLSREMETLGPMAVAEMVTMTEALLPVFTDEGRQQLERRQPEIEAVLNNQAAVFMDELREDTHARLLTTKARIQNGAGQLLISQYPDMTEERQELLVHLFVSSIDQQLNASVDDFVRRYSIEAQTLMDALYRFDVKGEGIPTQELQRQLVHLWLQAIDERIMNS